MIEAKSAHYEYYEWTFAGKGVPWRAGGDYLEEYEKMERQGWKSIAFYDSFILMRRKLR